MGTAAGNTAPGEPADDGSASGRRRPGYEPGGRRDAILDAAMEAFGARGYNGTSLAKIADRVGVTQQGLLHYFPSKQALLVAVLERRDSEDAPVAANVTDAEGARRGLLEVVRRNTERAGIVQAYSVLSSEAAPGGHPAHSYFRDRFHSMRAEFSGLLAAGYGERLPSGLSPEEAAALIVAALDGLQVQWLYAPAEIDMPQLVEALMDTFAADRTAG
ncbi:TetR/AcrR family transcriptional regulator [Nocardiopsis coralliicola]